MNALAYGHWDPSDKFQITIAGTAQHRSAIASIAQNDQGTPALTICLAYIELDNQNPHDPYAVRIVIRGQLVGYLPAGYAKVYRSYISELPAHIKHVSVAASITGGLTTKERAYEYRIELDIPENLKMQVLCKPMSDEVIRINGYAPLKESGEGIFTAKVWIPTADISELHAQLHLQEWTTDEWDDINIYVLNRQGIGLGYKLYAIPKRQYKNLFHGKTIITSLEPSLGRFATLRIAIANSHRLLTP